ncbi:MAG TPA: universal stress protein [Gammaproteobacteria bacterium]|nr:universal stress protein [Gammaproteobacteria bacterium]
MKVLIAIDGSENALRALTKFLHLTKSFTDLPSITLISVHDDSPFYGAARFAGRESVVEYLKGLSVGDLAGAQARLDEWKIPHHVVMAVGEIASTIVRHADENGFDLIVMGSKGRTNLGNLLMGSVATKVLAATDKPVLLVGEPERETRARAEHQSQPEALQT